MKKKTKTYKIVSFFVSISKESTTFSPIFRLACSLLRHFSITFLMVATLHCFLVRLELKEVHNAHNPQPNFVFLEVSKESQHDMFLSRKSVTAFQDKNLIQLAELCVAR